METYDQSEREQIETIKKWWKENGASVVIGIVLGIGIIFGWRGWQTYLQQQADIASSAYEHMLLAFEQNYETQGRQEASLLMSEYSKTTYASLAALYLAKQELAAGNMEASHVNLKWMIEQNVMPELTQIARLRQAHLYLAENKIAEAKNALMGVQGTQFKASLSELKGDIAVLENDLTTAREAYQTALESDLLASSHRTLLQMKLDDLGVKAPEFALNQKPKAALGSPTTLQDSSIVVDKPIVTETMPKAQPVSPIKPTDIMATPATQEDTATPISNELEVDEQSALEIKSVVAMTPIFQPDNNLSNVISAVEMQLAAIPNQMLHAPIIMTPRELQDNPVTFPSNTWSISTQATQPHALPTFLLETKQESQDGIIPLFSSINQELTVINYQNEMIAIAPMTLHDNTLTMPLYSEQI